MESNLFGALLCLFILSLLLWFLGDRSARTGVDWKTQAALVLCLVLAIVAGCCLVNVGMEMERNSEVETHEHEH